MDGCDVRLVVRVSFEGVRREHGPNWGRRNTVPLKVQGHMKCVFQEVGLQSRFPIDKVGSTPGALGH